MNDFLKPKFIIGILFSIIGLYFSFKDFNFNSFIEIIKETKIFYVFLASFLLIFSIWLRAIRWQYILLKEKKIQYKTLFEVEMIGYFGNNVLPLRLGELYRSIVLSKITNIPRSTVIGSVVSERFFDTIGLMFFSTFLLFYPIENQIKNYIYLSLIFIFTVSIIFMIVYKIFYQNIKIELLKNFLNGIYGLDRKKILKSIMITIFMWSIFWVNTFLIQYSLDIKMSFLETLLVFVISTLSIAIPSAPGTIGTFHLAVIYTMQSLLGYNGDVANAYAILLHAFGFFTFTFVGLGYFIKYQSYDFYIK